MSITNLNGPEDYLAEMLRAWRSLAATEPNSEAAHYAKGHLAELGRLATVTLNESAIRFMFREAVLAHAQTWRENYSAAELAAQPELEELVKRTVGNGHTVGRWLMEHWHHLG